MFSLHLLFLQVQEVRSGPGCVEVGHVTVEQRGGDEGEPGETLVSSCHEHVHAPDGNAERNADELQVKEVNIHL